jgi:cytoskeletal protein CcmA (bactofilin family)
MSFFGNRRQSEPDPPRIEQRPISSLSITQNPLGFESVLGASTTLEGTLESHGNIRLDGTFSGTLKITGNVLVGETATINADINAKNVSIAGAVRGNVSGKKVQILRTGKVWGDISATAFSTEEGAFIDGKISMKSSQPETEEDEESAVAEAEISATDTAMISRKDANEAIARIHDEQDETSTADSEESNPRGDDD